MITITLQVREVAVDGLPDVDTDVLIFDASHPQGQLGALIGGDARRPLWCGAQGESQGGVTHWAPLPELCGRAVRAEGYVSMYERPPVSPEASQVLGALKFALEQLEGWINWKCPAKHKAEHLAKLAELKAIGGF